MSSGRHDVSRFIDNFYGENVIPQPADMEFATVEVCRISLTLRAVILCVPTLTRSLLVSCSVELLCF